jgi:Protein of unknown function (DUF2939)
MRARWPFFATVVALGAGYVLYPYVTLYRLDCAFRQADSATLVSLVDWYSVREGLKEDLCDLAVDEPAADPAHSHDLAPFGASFVRGITGNMLDKTITPERVMSMGRTGPAEPGTRTHVVWAFFNNPTQPIRMVMELRDMRWRVRRVWLPSEMLERANSGT